MENTLIGTKGWSHKTWLGSFYPDDMPVDWQLDYYSNQFACVLVTQQEWEQWSTEQIVEIANNLAEETFFITLLVSTCKKDQLKKIKKVLGNLFHGVLVTKYLDFYSNDLAVEITIKSRDARINTKLTNNRLTTNWQFQYENNFYTGFPLIELNLAKLSIVEQKELLINLSQSFPKTINGGLIYITNIEENTQKIEDFKILAELLGL